MKSANVRAGPVHAQPKFRRIAGGLNLGGAISDAIHQTVLPALRIAHRVGRQQRVELVDLRLVQRADPLRVEARRQRQHEQFRRVAGFGRARQQLAAQPVAKFAHKGRARCKAEVGQQGRDIDGLRQHLAPGMQARLKLGLVSHRFDKRLDPRHSGLRGGAVAAYPCEKLDQPDMPVGQAGPGVQRPQQARQVFHRKPPTQTLNAARASVGCRHAPLPERTGRWRSRSVHHPRQRRNSCRAWFRWACAAVSRWCTGTTRPA